MSAHGSLTLWDIETAVLGLSEVIESPDTTEEEKQAARGELERWVQTEIKKIDRVRGFLRHCAIMEEAAKFEAMSMHVKAQTWADRAKRLKGFCISAMQASGVKRLEGQSGVLRIQAAGGKQKLNITREDLVPDAATRIQLDLAFMDHQQMIGALQRCGWDFNLPCNKMFLGTRRIDTEMIRKALETKCAACCGDGVMAISIGGLIEGDVPCAECRGTGHQLVPGAELEPRSVSLRVE